MKSFGLDSKNDLLLENGFFKLVEDAAAVVQSVRSRLLFYKEEWFLDRAAGTPWFQEVFIKPLDLANVESIIKTRILGTPGIDILLEFFMDFDSVTRRLTVTFSAETEYGVINSEEVTVNV